jgi:hypothetical protein
MYFFLSKWNENLALVVSSIPVVVTLWLITPFPYWNFMQPPNGSDIKSVMEYVGGNRLQDDVVYVFHSSDPAFNYYAPFYDLDSGNIIIGFETAKKSLALRRFYADVDSLRGKDRVWFIFSDIVDCGGCEGNMQEFYVDYLNAFGTLLDSFYASGANVYLYKMNP